MRFIADFHIHSRFSAATSRNLTPEHLEYWARMKGIRVIGTGDCVHPGWLAELRDKLEPAGNGLYRLREEFRLEESKALSGPVIPDTVFFMLAGEVSSIYKKNGRVRKVHSICVFPDFESAGKLQARLDRIGNIRSDGRPILGLDAKILLEMVLDSGPRSFVIPAHIWTPWFSVLGSKSGFDSIAECYDDLTREIFAVETGLSSDPPMNHACSFLDPFKLVSNSDAHSPEKLGREANIFDTEIGYGPIYDALRGESGFLGTIEFYPEEGKYHYDGHRKCNVRWDPLETILHDGICPVCGNPVTLGVLYRVAELADRKEDAPFPNRREYSSITQLADLLAEVQGVRSSSSRVVQREYLRLIQALGPEFHILLDADLADIREAGGDILAEGIRRLRAGNVIIEDGFDGEFGRIRVFGEGELDSFTGKNLFGETPAGNGERTMVRHGSINFDIGEFQLLRTHQVAARGGEESPSGGARRGGADEQRYTGAAPERPALEPRDEQLLAINHESGPCMVIAGPGTGKTRVLTERIVSLCAQRGVPPQAILAVTFSNRAAGEIRERLAGRITGGEPNVSTFHAFGLSVLREQHERAGRTADFFILDTDDAQSVIARLSGSARTAAAAAKTFERFKQGQGTLDDAGLRLFRSYEEELARMNAFDLADLLAWPVAIFREHPSILRSFRDRYPQLLVDEFQDINARQYELMTLLAGPGSPDIFVIGDPDQAIYAFRGADPRFLEKFAADFPGAAVIRLSASFRCPDPVMRAAGQLLLKERPIDGKPATMKIRVQEAPTDRSEADWIAATIESMMGGVRSFSMDSGMADGTSYARGASFSDFSILCRSSFMFPLIAGALANHGIAYQVIGTEAFYAAEPYRSFLSQLRACAFRSAPDPHNKKADDIARELHPLVRVGRPVTELVERLAATRDLAAEQEAALISLAAPFGNDYGSFFRSLSLRQGTDDFIPRETVSLMTLHASKGLEFNVVFIPGCEEGIIPFELFGRKSPEESGEEERLFYVGVTRTKQELFLSYAKKRVYRGRVLEQKKSPLLERLEKELLVVGKREPGRKKENDDQLDLFSKEG